MDSIQVPVIPVVQGGIDSFQNWAKKNKLQVALDEGSFIRPLGRMRKEANLFEASLAASNSRVLAFGTSVAVLNSVSQGMRAIVRSTIEVEKSLIDINRILTISEKGLQKFGTSLFKIAQETSTSFKSVADAALEFSRQGLSANQVLERTSETLKLVRLTGLDAAKAVELLTATVNAFDGLKLSEAVNKFVAVEAQFAVSARDLVEGLSRVGSAAVDAKVNLDELNALVATVQQTTGRGGPVIGNALKTIFTRLQRTDTLDALSQYNIAVKDIQGNTLPAVMILQSFAKTYDKLTDSSKSYLREQVAGVYQGNILSAILKDLTKQQRIYDDALEKSKGAKNEATIANLALQKSFSSLLAQTSIELEKLGTNVGKNTFQSLGTAIAESIKSGASLANQEMEGEGISIGRGLLKGISNILSGPGLILFGAVALKAMQNMFNFAKDAIPSLMGINTLKMKQANTEEFILNLMKQSDDMAQLILNKENSREIAAQKVLEIALKTTKQLEKQKQVAEELSKVITPQIGSASITPQGVVETGHKRRKDLNILSKAEGYLPPIAKESENIKNGVGGAPTSSFPVMIKDFPFGKGKKGPIVANSSEFIVPNYDGKGGAAIFNQQMIKTMGKPTGAIPVAAGGYYDDDDYDEKDASQKNVEDMLKRVEASLGKKQTFEEAKAQIEARIAADAAEKERLKAQSEVEAEAEAEVTSQTKSKETKSKPKTETKSKVKSKSKTKSKSKAEAKAEAKAKADAEAKAKADAEAKAKADAEAKAKAQTKPKKETPPSASPKVKRPAPTKKKTPTKAEQKKSVKSEIDKLISDVESGVAEYDKSLPKFQTLIKKYENLKGGTKKLTENFEKLKKQEAPSIKVEEPKKEKATKPSASEAPPAASKMKLPSLDFLREASGEQAPIEPVKIPTRKVKKPIPDYEDEDYEDEEASTTSQKTLKEGKSPSIPVIKSDFDDDDDDYDDDDDEETNAETVGRYGEVSEQKIRKQKQIDDLLNKIQKGEIGQEQALSDIERITLSEPDLMTPTQVTKAKSDVKKALKDKLIPKIQDKITELTNDVIEKEALSKGEAIQKLKESDVYKSLGALDPNLAEEKSRFLEQTISGKETIKNQDRFIAEFNKEILPRIEEGSLQSKDAISQMESMPGFQSLSPTQKGQYYSKITKAKPKPPAPPSQTQLQTTVENQLLGNIIPQITGKTGGLTAEQAIRQLEGIPEFKGITSVKKRESFISQINQAEKEVTPKPPTEAELKRIVEDKLISDILPKIGGQTGGLTGEQAIEKLKGIPEFEQIQSNKTKQSFISQIQSKEKSIYKELEDQIKEEESRALKEAKAKLKNFLESEGGLYSEIGKAKTIDSTEYERRLKEQQAFKSIKKLDPTEAQKQITDLSSKIESRKQKIQKEKDKIDIDILKSQAKEVTEKRKTTVDQGQAKQLGQDFNFLYEELKRLGAPVEALHENFKKAKEEARKLIESQKNQNEVQKQQVLNQQEYAKTLDQLSEKFKKGEITIKELSEGLKEFTKKTETNKLEIPATVQNDQLKQKINDITSQRIGDILQGAMSDDIAKQIFNREISLKDFKEGVGAEFDKSDITISKKNKKILEDFYNTVRDSRQALDISFNTELERIANQFRTTEMTLQEAEDAIEKFINGQKELNAENKQLLIQKSKERLESASQARQIAKKETKGISTNAALALTLGLPMVGGLVQEAITQGKQDYQLSRTQRIADKTIGVGTTLGGMGATIGGTMFGLKGELIGGLAGALIGFGYALTQASKSLEEMAQTLEETNNKTKENKDSVKERIKLIQELGNGEKRTKLEELDLRKQINENLIKIEDENLRKKIAGAKFDIDSINKVLEEYKAERTKVESIAGLGLAIKQMKEKESIITTTGYIDPKIAVRKKYGKQNIIEDAMSIGGYITGLKEEYSKEDIKKIEKAAKQGSVSEIADAFNKVLKLPFEQQKKLKDSLEDASDFAGSNVRFIFSNFGDFLKTFKEYEKEDDDLKDGVEAFYRSVSKLQKAFGEVTNKMLLASDELLRINNLSNSLYESLESTFSDIGIGASIKSDMQFANQISNLDYKRASEKSNLITQNLDKILESYKKAFIGGEDDVKMANKFAKKFLQSPQEGLGILSGYINENKTKESSTIRLEEIKPLEELIFQLNRQLSQQESNYNDELVLISLKQGIENLRNQNIEKERNLSEGVKKEQLQREKDFVGFKGRGNLELDTIRFITNNIDQLKNLSPDQRLNIRNAATTQSFKLQRQLSNKEFANKKLELQESQRIESQRLESEMSLVRSNFDLIESINSLTNSINEKGIRENITNLLSDAAELSKSGKTDEAKAKEEEVALEKAKLEKLEAQKSENSARQKEYVNRQIENLQSTLNENEKVAKLQEDIITEEQRYADLASQQQEAYEIYTNGLNTRTENIEKSLSQLEQKNKIKSLNREIFFEKEEAALRYRISEDEFKMSQVSSSPYMTEMQKAKKRLQISREVDKNQEDLLKKQFELRREELKSAAKLEIQRLKSESLLIDSNINLGETNQELKSTNDTLIKALKNFASRLGLDIGIDEGSANTNTIAPVQNDELGQKIKERRRILKKELELLDVQEEAQIKEYQQRANQNREEDIRKAQKPTFGQGLRSGFAQIRQDVDDFEHTMGSRIPISFRDNMAQALNEIGDKAKSIEEALRDAAISFLTEIRNAFNQRTVGNIMLGFETGFGAIKDKFATRNQRGGIIKAQNGMYISGSRTGDKNPALLEDGEYVLNRNAVRAMGGPAALDRLNFAMAPRFANGGYANLNEPIDSNRFSGFFYQSQNPELQEKRAEFEAEYRARLQKEAEKKAKSKQLKQLIASVAVSTAMSVGSSYAKDYISGLKADKFIGPQQMPDSLPEIDVEKAISSYSFNKKISGGLINKGFANKDSVPVFAAGGEYMLNSKAVRKYGVPYLSRLNGGEIPAYQAGGAVSDANLGSQATQNYKTEININMNGSSSANVSSDASTDVEKQKELSKRIESAVRKIIQEEQRPTGLLSRRGRKL